MQKLQEKSLALLVIYSYTLLATFLIIAVYSSSAQNMLFCLSPVNLTHIKLAKKIGYFLNIQKCVKGSSKQIQCHVTLKKKKKKAYLN